ncbi:MAG: cell division protein FtsA [Ruminococcaceae bacterium]|nr:cell division protein FtsA [Oscillospiraceae bacterium]
MHYVLKCTGASKRITESRGGLILSKNIAVLDIGTTGVRILAAKVNEGGLPHIVAKVAIPCRGLKKFKIYDREVLVRAIGQAVLRIQEQTGIVIKSVYSSVQSAYVKYMHNADMIEISDTGREITYHDIATLLDKVASVEMYDDEVLLDVSPLKFVIDGEATVVDPIGLSAKTLEVEADIVLGQAEYINDVKDCIEDAGLEIDGFVPVSLAMAGLMPEYSEECKSVLMIDVGGSVTDYTLYYKGKPYAIGAIPVGGDNISSDLSQVFKVSPNEAEALKRDYPLASATLVTNNIDIAIHSLASGEQEIIKVEEPVQVMQARIEEIFSMVGRNLNKENININSIDRVIVSGDGLVPFKGTDVICKNILNVQLLEIDFSRLTGMKSVYTYASGMVMYISSQLPLGRKQSQFEKEYQTNDIPQIKKKGFAGILEMVQSKMKNMFTGFRE